MDSPLLPSETEIRAQAFLQMGGQAGQTGKRYTQRCIALLNFLGRQSPLASAMAVELQRLHSELAAYEQSEAKLLQAFTDKLQTHEQAQLATTHEIIGLKGQLLNHEQLEALLREELESLQGLQARLTDAMGTLAQRDEQLAAYQADEARLQQELVTLREQIQTQTETLAQLQALRDTQDTVTANLQAEIQRLTAQAATDKTTQDRLHKDIESLRSIETYQEEEIGRMQTLLGAGKESHLALQAELSVARERETAHEAERVQLQEQLEARSASEEALAKTVDELHLKQAGLMDEIAVHEQVEQRRALDAARAVDDFSLPHPFQPLTIDDEGRVKFWSNAIVAWAIQNSPFKHAPFPHRFSMSDREQLAQLLGMELDVFTLQPFVRPYTAQAAEMMDLIPLPCPPPPLQDQDIVVDGQNGMGFRCNALVRFLVAQSFLTPAQIDALPANAHDRKQFDQLMGKSLVGAGDRLPANQGSGDADTLAA